MYEVWGLNGTGRLMMPVAWRRGRREVSEKAMLAYWMFGWCRVIAGVSGYSDEIQTVSREVKREMRLERSASKGAELGL